MLGSGPAKCGAFPRSLLLALALLSAGCVRAGLGLAEDVRRGEGILTDGRSDGREGGQPAQDTWVTIAAGAFIMGSVPSELCRGEADETQHPVTLTHDFVMQATEVTRGQFQRLMGYDPSQVAGCTESCPVETVNWHEAAAYCNALSTGEGRASCYACTGSGTAVTCGDAPAYGAAEIYHCLGYRLPTEAERERAYRAGTTTMLYSGPIAVCTGSDGNADAIGWHSGNSGGTPHPVAQRAANAWGLYDMAGNLWEWCHEWYQIDLGSAAVTDPWGVAIGSQRTVRGGSWRDDLGFMRAANRSHPEPSDRSDETGFRCVRTLP